MENYDIIIIGAGPGGLTAGIYAGRQGTKNLIIDRDLAGGIGREVPEMENYPGFENISGLDLIEKMKAQSIKNTELHEMEEVTDLKLDGDIKEVMNPTPIDKKFEAFGWNVLVVDAHNFEELSDAIETAKTVKGKPTAIIMKSIKGKNVSFMENEAGWHGAAPNKEQYEQAINELDKIIGELEA